MESKLIYCVQCDAEFEFSVEDQQAYEAKGYDEPKRCPDCRRRKLKSSTNDSDDKWKTKKKRHHDRYDDDI
jgi:NAD-dependent SIR2 family protein deacetylase